MYVFERFNSWICKRSLNMRYPEATATETFLIHEWCQFMVATERIPHSTVLSDCNAYDNEHEILVEMNDKLVSGGKSKLLVPKMRDLNRIHKLCGDEPGIFCKKEDCSLTKYHVHHEEYPVTKRIVTYKGIQIC